MILPRKHADQKYMQTEVFPKFKTACIEALAEERFFGTTNHYFDAKFREDEICSQELIETFYSRLKNKDFSRDTTWEIIKDCLLEAKKEVAEREVHTDLLETQKKRVFAAVKAHFDVEKKTFVDNLLKKTKDILIKGHEEWVSQHFLRSATILEAAKEDENTCNLRKELVERIDRLNDCMSLLRDVPLPAKDLDDIPEEDPKDVSRTASNESDSDDD